MTGDIEKRKRCLERLQLILRTVLEDGALVISEELAHNQIPSWDPITHLAEIAGIEKSFSLRFSTREVGETGKPTATIGTLIDLILEKAAASSMSLRSSLQGAVSDNHRRQLLQHHAVEQLAAVLGVKASEVDTRKTFLDLGVTSLSAIELCSRLELGLGVGISPVAVYNYPSIEQLVTYIAGKLMPEAIGAAKEPGTP